MQIKWKRKAEKKKRKKIRKGKKKKYIFFWRERKRAFKNNTKTFKYVWKKSPDKYGIKTYTEKRNLTKDINVKEWKKWPWFRGFRKLLKVSKRIQKVWRHALRGSLREGTLSQKLDRNFDHFDIGLDTLWRFMASCVLWVASVFIILGDFRMKVYHVTDFFFHFF